MPLSTLQACHLNRICPSILFGLAVKITVQCPSLVACIHGRLALQSRLLPIAATPHIFVLFSVSIATLEGQLKEQVGNQEAQQSNCRHNLHRHTSWCSLSDRT